MTTYSERSHGLTFVRVQFRKFFPIDYCPAVVTHSCPLSSTAFLGTRPADGCVPLKLRCYEEAEMKLTSTKAALGTVMLICMWIVCAASSRAQEYRGSLFGNVLDPSGAVVPNAKIAIKNNATNLVTNVQSSTAGTYSALDLDAGTYTVTVTAPGFSTLVQNNVEVRTGVRFGLDLPLKTGAVTEEVVVSTAPPLLITDTGSGGTVLTNELVDSIPLVGSNVYSLIQTTAGASHGSAFPDHLSERPFDNG